MINFRYHVVSLAAVFLALALGLVVGTTALNGPAVEELSNQVASLRNEKEALRDEVNHLKTESEQEEEFATEAMPYLFAEKLANRRILVVTTADADKEYVDGMTKAFQIAGAKVTGRIAVQKRFLEPDSKEELLDLVDTTTPAGVTGLPANSNGVETSAALLAVALMDREPALPDPDRVKVISAYKDAGYLVVTPGITGPAEAVLLLTGKPYTDKDASKLNGAVKVLVEQFDKAGRLVVAGSGTGGTGNLIAAVRDDATLGKQVSTVDNVASPQGRAAATLALVEQLEGRSGHYGVDGDSLLPKTAATRNGS